MKQHNAAMRPATEAGKRQPLKLNFTATALAAIKAPATGQAIVYDSVVRGLCLLVTANGARTFYVARRFNGRYQRAKIGGFPELSVERARDMADEINWDRVRGVDPQEKRRAERAEWTIAELFQNYLEKHAKPHKKQASWEADEARFKKYLKDRRGWAGRRVGTIKHEDVQALHSKVGAESGKYAANRLLAMLSTMFNTARLPNPCKGVRKFKEQSRDRYLTGEEFPRFMAALLEEPNQTIRDFILVSLFTGQRRGNTQAMKWGEIDMQAAVWRIPDTKSGEPVRVHLPEPAMQVLRQRKADNDAAEEDRRSEYVFPGRSGGHLAEPKTTWEAILTRAKIKDLRLHDLRRTAGSWAAATGASLPIIGKALGHKSTAVTAVYARLDLDPIKAAMDKATAAMMEAANGKPAEEPKPTGPIGPTTDGTHGSHSIADELAKLAALRTGGLLTDEEFAAAKAKLLAK